MKVYTDITNYLATKRLTGIQRVVSKTGEYLEEKLGDKIVFLKYENKVFKRVTLTGEELESRKAQDGYNYLGISFEPGDTFLEMDAAWHIKLDRNELYSKLKNLGVRIVVFYQDIIPVMYPEYADKITRVKFTGFLEGALKYADVFVSSAEENNNYLKALIRKLDLKEPECYSVGLGCDIEKKTGKAPSKDVEGVVNMREPYVLMVGTIEPRKNHKCILDAFDNDLFKEGYNLVIAGKKGWNTKDVADRIKNHPQLGKKLFYFEKATDADIETLYQNAYITAFPSFIEGYGLPIVESLMRKTPVIASDNPVHREVGKEACIYFNPNDPKDFTVKLKDLSSEEKYKSLKEKLEKISFNTWEETGEKLYKIISKTPERELKVKDSVPQLVVLTARCKDLLGSLPYYEEFTPFIKKVLVCCPEKVKREIEESYKGRLTLEFLTDEELCQNEVPRDHAARNVLLRSRMLANPKTDSLFIMADDDYRPVREADQSFFVREGKYTAFYCGLLTEWRGTQHNESSFDRSMFKCRDFLVENGLPAYMFDSHMPQIIDKELYREFMEAFPEACKKGEVSEWSGYFNYCINKYPEAFRIRPYVTLNWPGHLKDWNLSVVPDDFYFENYYEESYKESTFYKDKGVFFGLSKEWGEKSFSEGKEKITRYKKEIDRYLEAKKVFEENTTGDFVFVFGEKEPKLMFPGEITLTPDGFCRVYVKTVRENSTRNDSNNNSCIGLKNSSKNDSNNSHGNVSRIDLKNSSCNGPKNDSNNNSCIGLKNASRCDLDNNSKSAEVQVTFNVFKEGKVVSDPGSSRFNPMDEGFIMLLTAPSEKGTYEVGFDAFCDSKTASATVILKVI
ncbi:MAG: glycosyltransferase [Lachnospiraceae bacterium]|nr:glycosyltransferase [Lachnospiraceae bacterium]